MWIELHQEFRNHPKVFRLARMLNIESALAKGYVINLWLWAVSYASSGDLKTMTPAELAEACDAKIDAQLLYDSLIKTRFIDENGDQITLHDWKKHGLRVLVKSKNRLRKFRIEQNLEKKTETFQKRYRNAIPSILSFLSIPSNHIIYSPEFRKSLDEWVAYKKEIRKPISISTLTKQLKMLSLQADPIGCIEQSIRNGWQGLFELKGNSNGNSNSSSSRKHVSADDLANSIRVAESLERRDSERAKT